MTTFKIVKLSSLSYHKFLVNCVIFLSFVRLVKIKMENGKTIFRGARDLCIEVDDNGVELVTEETDCFDHDINRVVCADSIALSQATCTSGGRSICPPRRLVTDLTPLVRSCVTLLSYQTHSINYYHSASIPEAWRI